MTAYLTRRILWLVPVLLLVSMVTFALMHVVPGGPWDQDRPLPPTVKAARNHEYHLDKPVVVQYGYYLKGILHGDLGVSFTETNRPVTSILKRGLRTTATLGLLAFVTAIGFGVVLGTVAAFNQNGPLDYISVFFGTIGASCPSFIIAVLLIVIFVVKLHWFNVIGFGSWKNSVLPVVSLAFLPASYISRVARASMLEVIRQDYVRTARAKGLADWTVDRRHVVRNALIPILTITGPIFAGLVSGSFIIETVFSIAGVGRQFVESVLSRDYAVIMGTTLLYATAIVLANLIVDLLYAVADPRIRYA